MMEASCKSLIAPGLVDSRLKLHLLLLFYRHPRLSAEAWSLSEWLHESPWAIEEAIESLADIGFLAWIEGQPHRQYRLEPSLERWTLLQRLAALYDDPQRRDDIDTLMRLADQERRFRAWLAAEERTTSAYGTSAMGSAVA